MSDSTPYSTANNTSTSRSNTAQHMPLTHHHVAVSASTNTEVLQGLASGNISKSEPYMLTASMQTAGRGQHTRTWQSPIGNIYLSLYHPLSTPLSGLLSLVVGYHLTQLPLIQSLNRQRKTLGLPVIGVKWANDIGYYDLDTRNNTSFYKLAGILIEPVMTDNKITGVVVGVGINIEAAPLLSEKTKEGMDYQAISLSQIIEQTQAAVDDSTTDNLSANNTKPASATLNTSRMPLPRAQDLYISVSATLLKAIDQFNRFGHDPYALPHFINDYSAVNVLAGRDICITQNIRSQSHKQSQSQSQPQSNPQSKQTSLIQKTITGVVEGINEDGSLKVTQHSTAATTYIYTGTLRLIDS
ncbi:biotin--[acetyl-CoA-carboxylase] ligase [Psychrobacter sp. FDAARGOS_221]|uniref:biotin--[acetyl-CoA-carboxylase] ligase n=1 Tax=Psychrobacter sp. FDAARGOS_221 TaxID=1975705 RepID=UPI000BB564B1|nr:ligase [Psychrobacter sp. FDAARGOS_221]PNK61833.1 ligase [Psychrobacter sp. FDAARGOS_221]